MKFFKKFVSKDSVHSNNIIETNGVSFSIGYFFKDLGFFFFCKYLLFLWASLVAQMVKDLPAMQETPVQFLGWEDLLEKG